MAADRSARARSKALQIYFGRKPIRPEGGGIYNVPSQTVGGRFYTVNLNRNTCECKSFTSRKAACKHIFAARMFRDKITKPVDLDERPPKLYRNPKDYVRLRVARRPVSREMLRCLALQVNSAR